MCQVEMETLWGVSDFRMTEVLGMGCVLSEGLTTFPPLIFFSRTGVMVHAGPGYVVLSFRYLVRSSVGVRVKESCRGRSGDRFLRFGEMGSSHTEEPRMFVVLGMNDASNT